MHTRLLACTRRPEVLRGLAHVYVPQRCFSQLTFLLNQSKSSEEDKKTTGRRRSRFNDDTRLGRLERRFWQYVSQKRTQSGTEGGTKSSDALKSQLAEIRKSVEGVRKYAEGVNTAIEMNKKALANTNERNKEITTELGILFKQSKELQLQCKAVLLKQVANTLLGETPPSATASMPDKLLSNRKRYSEVGLSSPEQMDWISAQWKTVFDERNIELGPLSLFSIFTILKHLKQAEKDVYLLVFQHISGKRFAGWLKNSTQEEKDKVFVP